MRRETIRKIKELCTVVAAALAALVFCHLLGITCPIKYVTGISCPGCGMTRAWLSLLRGDTAQAFAYHPLFLLVLPAAAYLAVRYYLRKRGLAAGKIRRLDTIALAAVCIAMFTCYGLRLADPQDSIVVFQPQSGIFYRVFTWLGICL